MKKQIIYIILIILLIFLFYKILLLINNKKNMEQIGEIQLTSEVFQNNQSIPLKYSCNGENINPPLSIKNIPINTKSLTLIVDDPDAPSGNWTHWLIWNIPSETSHIETNSLPNDVIQGLNSSKNNKYDGPCPPSGTHRYFFKLYALDTILNLKEDSKKNNLEDAMKGHILGQTTLIGLYSKIN